MTKQTQLSANITHTSTGDTGGVVAYEEALQGTVECGHGFKNDEVISMTSCEVHDFCYVTLCPTCDIEVHVSYLVEYSKW